MLAFFPMVEQSVKHWAEEELATIDLGDSRLERRAQKVLARLGDNPAASLPKACRGWAELQGAYRFFDNERVDWHKLLEPHWEQAERRMQAESVVLCIQDTTELDFSSQKHIEGLGPLSYAAQHGMYLHPTLAVTPERLPLGVLDAWMWARDPKTHGRDKAHLRTEKESVRWLEGYARVAELAERLPETQVVYVADRECDIYAFMHQAQQSGLKAQWLIRAVHNRVIDADEKLWDEVGASVVLGQVKFTLPGSQKRKAREVVQTLQAQQVTLTPKGKAPVTVTALLAQELAPPPGEKALVWRLLSSLPGETLEQVVQLIEWYRCRFQIEVYFRIYKSGCKVQTLQLGEVERLEPALALYMIIAWRVMWLTVLGRTCPDLPCDAVFDDSEWQAVFIVTEKQPPPATPPKLNTMILMVAQFGGYLGRKGDGPPGAEAIWTGLQRARDFAIGIQAVAAMKPS